MKIILFKILILISLCFNDARIIQDEGDDHSVYLGPDHNQGAPLYFDTADGGHHREHDEYPGYDGYASYAPHHDHERYAYPRYKFEYGVHDPHSGDIKKQYEERDGDTVRGYYSLVEPDGSIRIVEYTADAKHGFQATVRKIGPHHHPTPLPAVHHPHPETNYNQAYPNYPSHRYPSHRDPTYVHDDHSYEKDYHLPVAPYPLHSSGEHGYGYNVYEPAEKYNDDYSKPYGSGHEYDDNGEDYPYHSNVNYPVYVLPQNGNSAVLDVLGYDGHQFIENADKYFHKRSPNKKNDQPQIGAADKKRTPKSKEIDWKTKKIANNTKTENVKLAAVPTTIANLTRHEKVSETIVAGSSNSTVAVKSEKIKLTTVASPTTKTI